MSAVNDLIRQIADAGLRERIQKEVNKLSKQKKFGLVFEEHIPECTPLWNMPIRRGSKVALKAGPISDFYYVMQINEKTAICARRGANETVELMVNDIVAIAEFGEPIYPYLEQLDSVCNASDDDLWHALIEADNFHALQLLEYLYGGKVDCIYIDPPYNTGARDWKYNNDYVDSADSYRHSKWLSFIEKRLAISKRLLNPKKSVLIVTIDEKEYLHLGCLLEEMFPEANIQMISTVINPAGASRSNAFSRTGEYIFCVQLGDASPAMLELDGEWSKGKAKNESALQKAHWDSLTRSGPGSDRKDRPNMFYPIFISREGKYIGCGDALPLDVDRHTVLVPEGQIVVWPLHSDGSEGRWRIGKETFERLQKDHFVRIGGKTKNGVALYYLKTGEQEKVRSGFYEVRGIAEDNSYVLGEGKENPKFIPGDIWNISSHNASAYGSVLLKNLIGNRFSYPKSLYAVKDIIRFYTEHKKNSLIIDFFAGSGTTLHAVNLLNEEDGGKRRCIIVTNNEVSAEEAVFLKESGYQPGDDEWEKYGVARYVSWPRTVCSIKGRDVNGEPLKGNYLGSGIPMAQGLKANVVFFKLGFLDKTSVALGTQFREMLPILWMKAGAYGPCPSLTTVPTDMLILPKNKMAILLSETAFYAFAEKINNMPEIETVFIISDYDINYRNMVSSLNVRNSFQLYRDYLDNFRINYGRK